MKLNHKLALLLIAGTAGYVALQNLDLLRGSAKDEDPALLFNRIWMETKPENATDYVQGAYFLSRPQLGLFSDRPRTISTSSASTTSATGPRWRSPSRRRSALRTSRFTSPSATRPRRLISAST